MTRSSLLALALLALAPPFKLEAQITSREYGQRRDALASRLPADAVVLVLGAREPSEDYLEFFQTPGLDYLTGVREPDAALVMVKEGGRVSATLFVLPRDAAAEVWTGKRAGTDGATRITGLSARDAAGLRGALDSIARGKRQFYVIGAIAGQDADTLSQTPDEQLVAWLTRVHPHLRVTASNALLAQLRGKKSADEQALVRQAVDITVRAQREAMQAIRAGMKEYEIEAVIESVFRRHGAERPSFATIVASGPNSTTLHYNTNDRQTEPGDVIVMDIGASYRGYAADVTRTVPANGTYSAEQRQVYQLVRDAQAAAERQAKPGARARLMEDSATAVLAAGLARLGLIESVTAMYDGASGPEPQYRLYYMHGVGHGIGLEVHDPDQFYFTGVLAEGSAFTIEPGVYVRGNLLEILRDTPGNRALIQRIRPAVEKYANVGVRIEDDYIVTEKGVEWISRAPREIHEIEAVMKRLVP